MTTHKCPKAAFFLVVADTSIEGAEHLNWTALDWNALLLPAAAVEKNICGDPYVCLTEGQASFIEK